MCAESYKSLIKEIKEDLNGEMCSVQEWEDSILLPFQVSSNYLQTQHSSNQYPNRIALQKSKADSKIYIKMKKN